MQALRQGYRDIQGKRQGEIVGGAQGFAAILSARCRQERVGRRRLEVHGRRSAGSDGSDVRRLRNVAFVLDSESASGGRIVAVLSSVLGGSGRGNEWIPARCTSRTWRRRMVGTMLNASKKRPEMEEVKVAGGRGNGSSFTKPNSGPVIRQARLAPQSSCGSHGVPRREGVSGGRGWPIRSEWRTTSR